MCILSPLVYLLGVSHSYHPPSPSLLLLVLECVRIQGSIFRRGWSEVLLSSPWFQAGLCVFLVDSRWLIEWDILVHTEIHSRDGRNHNKVMITIFFNESFSSTLPITVKNRFSEEEPWKNQVKGTVIMTWRWGVSSYNRTHTLITRLPVLSIYVLWIIPNLPKSG